MNRIIKFRVWDGKKMYFDAIVGNGVVYYNGHQWFQIKQKVEIQQFTGLLDKNDKEIYEGDIVKTKSYRHYDLKQHGEKYGNKIIDSGEDGCMNSKIDVVKYIIKEKEESGFNCYYRYWTTKSHEAPYSYEAEVIGNIFENPELLNK